MGDVAAIGIALVLLIGNAFFVGAEFSLISARRTQVEPLAAGGSGAARITLRAMDEVSLMMACAQLGITVCSLGLGAVGEPAVAHLLEGPFAAVGVPQGLVHPIALAIALGIVTALHMVLGEMVPKNIALAGPERSATILGPILYALVFVLKPIVTFLNWLANIFLRMLRVRPQDEVTSTFTADEVVGFVRQSHDEGLLDPEERELAEGAMEFLGNRAAAVLLERAELVTVTEDATVDDVEALCAETGYSRFPLAEPDGDVRRYVHVKDLLATSADAHDQRLPRERLRWLVSISPDRPLREVLDIMQRRGAHLARVEDDDGRLLGVITLEDVLEDIVGEATAR